MPAHLCVDETKAKGYVLVAGLMLASDATRLPKDVRRLVAPGQHRNGVASLARRSA